MLIHEFEVWRREMWMIASFDDDDKYTDENLGKTLKLYPAINDEFQWRNKKVIVVAVFCIIANIVNVVVSGHVVLSLRYLGTTSVTTYITYVLLLVNVFKGVITNAYKGITDGRGYSNITSEPFEWNMISPKLAGQGQAEDKKETQEKGTRENGTQEKEAEED